MMRALGVLAFSLWLPPGAMAQDSGAEAARRAIEMLEAAARAHETASGQRDRVKALTRSVLAYEEGLAALRAGTRDVVARERNLQSHFEERSQELSRLLGALSTIEQSRSPIVLLHPDGPMNAARASMILTDVLPALSEEVADLRTQLEDLAALRTIQIGAEAAVSEALRGVREARATLSGEIADRTAPARLIATESERLRALISSTDTLAAFADGLAALTSSPAQPRAVPSSGRLPLPVTGTQMRAPGQPDARGVVRPGLFVATSYDALVVAPIDGTIRYAGPLLDYGNVMILEPNAETLLVFAGLGALYGQAGHIVEFGDPLGLMPGAPDEGETIRMQVTGAEHMQTLYIEVRQGNAPVDPGTWFALENQK